MSSEAREGLIQVEGTEILVREVGVGPPILLINGIGAHTAMWNVMERTLSGLRILSFDAPGTGRSPSPCGVASVRRLARIAVGVLDHFGVSRADALGYSMGGIVLQQVCADFPLRIRRAALVGTTPGVGAVYGKTLAMLNVSTPLRYLSDGLYRRTIGQLAGGRARTDATWVGEHGAVRLRYRPSIRGYSKQVLALAGWSGLPILHKIASPTLVVTGDDDPLTPVVNSMMMAHLLRDGRLLVIPGEGHLMLLDDRSAVHPRIREFFEAESLSDASVWNEAVGVAAHELRNALAGRNLQIQPWPWGPVDCIYEGARKLYIHPEECIDCGACEPVCPVEAISPAEELCGEQEVFVRAEAEFFAKPLEGRAEALGSPGGAAANGPIGVDVALVGGYPERESTSSA